ncbi:DUF2628 domain-containing protein [Muricoccus radiodurans]|uniref:DUF2628 domain-containing protein n=1 Tax=Muricoccus radiodurans TaxID=2231721 RepID=UPI003CF69BB5
MRVFTVHARTDDQPRTRLVREGFSVWAFLLGPLWLLARGLWLALIGYIALVAVLLGAIGANMENLPSNAPSYAMLALHLLLGWHARDLQRWTLRRRGFAHHGVVVGNDRDDALLRLLTAKPALARGAIR